MSFRSLIFALLLPASLLALPGCEKDELRHIVNERLDLEGESCDPGEVRELVSETGYRICDRGRGIQKCGNDDWGIDGPVWGRCIPAEACTPGASVDTSPEDEICPGTITCIQVEDVTAWSDVPACNTPLVLRFDDAPVGYHAFDGSEAVAAFAPGGTCTSTDWPTANTPWLVLDRDGNGRIEGGEELFGSGTVLESGRKAKQGFEALAELDDNHDGRIDNRDDAYARLALWADHDGDRRSELGELTTLLDADISMLSVDFNQRIECDERGNCGRERADFEFASGLQSQVGEIVDIYLTCH
jgi:hypothetical protein